jgi:hypothetical protein
MGEIKPEVRVIVAGECGIGKSAVAGEIEIALRAIGVPVRYADEEQAASDKRMVRGDWADDLAMYQPRVVLEETVPSPSDLEKVYGLLWGVTSDDPRVHEARKVAMGKITKEGQQRGRNWAQQKLGPPDADYAAVRRGA